MAVLTLALGIGANTAGEACVKAGWQVHADCLMGNHFQLVVETPPGNLVAGMKWFFSEETEVDGAGVGAENENGSGEGCDRATHAAGDGHDGGVDRATVEDGQSAYGGEQFESETNCPIARTPFCICTAKARRFAS